MGILQDLMRTSGGSFVPAGEPMACSLNEMASSLSVVINEAVSELETDDINRKHTLLEAAVGDTTDAELIVLTESVVSSIKDKIKALFKKIREFILSIIEKIKQNVNALRMSGSQLVSKYKKDVVGSGKDYKDFVFEGYVFADPKSKYTSLASINIGEWLKSKDGVDLPSTIHSDISPTSSDDTFKVQEEEVEKKLEKLKDTSSEVAEIKVKYFNTITGLDAQNTSKFAELLFKDLRGGKAEKKEIKGFREMSLESIVKTLENPDDLNEMKNQYEKLKDSVEKTERECMKIIDGLKKDDPSDTKTSRSNYLKASYTDAWAKLNVSLLNVAADINNAKVRAAMDKANQARMVFIKALKYNPKKSNNNSFELEELSEFDYNLE